MLRAKLLAIHDDTLTSLFHRPVTDPSGLSRKGVLVAGVTQNNKIPYREPIQMVWGDCCEIQMWQHKAAELLYESACFEPTVFVQIRGTSCEPGT